MEKEVLATMCHLLDQLPPRIKTLPLRLYADNYFSGVPLAVEMASCGYAFTGTIHQNRVPNSRPLPGVRAMKRNERGSIAIVFDEADKVAPVRWKDNAVVTVVSTSSATNPTHNAARWSSAEKKKIIVQQPNSIHLYNKSNGWY